MKRTNVQKIERKLLNIGAKLKILDLLYKYPDKEFSLSDLADLGEVSKSNMGKILDGFLKEEIIQVEKLSKIWRIRANRKNQVFIRLKILYNLTMIYNTYFGEKEFIDIIDENFGHPKAIILFGSFRKGEDDSGSDIDLAIEVEGAKSYRNVELKNVINNDFRNSIISLENEIGRKFQMHIFSRKHIDKGLFNNIANGIVLSGFLEVKP